MTELATIGAYGELVESATLKIERLFPGPLERVWDYLTKSELRRRWLAAGEMEMVVGAPVELVWRNSELTDPPGSPPADFGQEHRMSSTVTEIDPPYRLAISWGSTGGVLFELKPQGDDVLLTLVHRRIPDRGILLNVSAGWHAHLDVLSARLNGAEPEPFWDAWRRLKDDYAGRLPA